MLAFNDKVNTIRWEDQSSSKGTALHTVPTSFSSLGQSSTPSSSPAPKHNLMKHNLNSQLSYELHSLLPSTINHSKEQNQSNLINSNKNLLHSVSNSRRCCIRRRHEAMLFVTHLLTALSSSTVSLEGRAVHAGPMVPPQVVLLRFVFNSQGLHTVLRKWKPFYILLYWVYWLI